MSPASAANSHAAGFRVFLRLRWAMLGAYALGCLGAVYLLDVGIYWPPVSACLLALAFANLLFMWQRPVLLRHPEASAAALLILDVLGFTFLLLWTGGAQNPFSTLYLLHVVLSCVMLRGAAAVGMLIFCVGCYGYLFLAGQAPQMPEPQNFHYLAMVLAMALTGGGIAYFFVRLNRDRVVQEAFLEEARFTAERTRRMASVANLAAGVAHALATPIGTIALISEEMQQRAESGSCDSENLEDIRQIRREVGVCRNLLRKIAAHGDDSEGESSRECTADEVVDYCLQQLKSEEIERINWVPPGHQARFQAPLESLAQALAILVRNGLQASPPLTQVKIDFALAGGRVEWQITDVGQGMGPELLERIGEPFFSTRKTSNNLGLGLFIVKSLAEHLRGELIFTSCPGDGTVALLRFPIDLGRNREEVQSLGMGIGQGVVS